MAAIDPAEFRRRVERYCVPGAVCGEWELDDVYRLATAVGDVMRDRCSQLLEAGKQRAVLNVYMSDGWGKKIRTSVSAKLEGTGVKLIREGRFKHEFLLERSLVRTYSRTAGHALGMEVGPPRGLEFGRASWHLFSAGTQFCPTLRAQGHQGISLSLYLFDGALFSSLYTKFCGLHNLWYDSDTGFADEDEAWMHKQSDLVFGIQCMVHAGNNSVDWAIRRLRVEDTSDRTYNSLNCLVQASAQFHANIDRFLQRVVAFEERVDDPTMVREFWQLLELTGPLLDLFTAIDPWWCKDRGQLIVSCHIEHEATCWEQLQIVVLACRRWCTWSPTRWARFGRSSRLFLRSLCTGLDAAFQDLLQDPLCSNENLAGYRQCDGGVRMHLAVAALCAMPAEKFLLDMLSDDRLARRSDEILQHVHDKLREVCCFPDLVYDRLASAVGETAEGYKHLVIMSACISFGYLWRSTFRELQFQPWSFTQGDIEAKVSGLAAGTIAAEDERILRMKNLLSAGTPQAALVEAFSLLRESPMSTCLVEEGHASAAMIMRDHSRYSEKALRARALLHQVRSVTRPKHVSTAEKSLVRRMERLKSYNPNKVRGRHMFLKQMVHASMSAAGREPKNRLQASRTCVKDCQKEYDALTPLEQADFEHEATNYVEEVKCARLADTTRMETQLRAIREQDRQAETARSVPNHIASVRFSDADLQHACEVYNSPAVQSLHLEAHFGAYGRGPTAPALHEQKQIEAEIDDDEAWGPAFRGEVPWWCADIARHRDAFPCQAIGFEEDGLDWWLVLFCKQSPHQCTFLHLHQREVVLDLDNADAVNMNHRVYDFFPPKVLTETEVPWPQGEEDPEIFVRSGVRARGLYMTTAHASMPFSYFMLIHAGRGRPSTGGRDKSAPPRKRGPKPTEDEREVIFADNQWLSDDDVPGGRQPPKRARKVCTADPRAADSGADTSSEAPDSASADEDVASGVVDDGEAPAGSGDDEDDDGCAGAAELADIRSELEWSADDLLFFYTRIQGGDWLRNKTGRSADKCTGFARGGWPQWWCDRYMFPRQRSFAFLTYERDNACMLAKEFCSRAEFFYRTWLLNHDAEFDFVFEQHHLDAYLESVPFLDWLLALSDEGPAFEAGVLLRSLCPLVGPLEEEA